MLRADAATQFRRAHQDGCPEEGNRPWLRGATLKECLGGAKEFGFKAVRIQQKSDGVECAWIIVDDCDDLSPR